MAIPFIWDQKKFSGGRVKVTLVSVCVHFWTFRHTEHSHKTQNGHLFDTQTHGHRAWQFFKNSKTFQQINISIGQLSYLIPCLYTTQHLEQAGQNKSSKLWSKTGNGEIDEMLNVDIESSLVTLNVLMLSV